MEPVAPVSSSAPTTASSNVLPLGSNPATTTTTPSPITAEAPPTSTAPPTSAVAMPAPKTQAPLRSRRLPAVDPSNLVPARRTSNRSIKRKKFDDELVESSLVKTERGGGRLKSAPASSVASATATVQSGGHVTQVHNPPQSAVSTPLSQQPATSPAHVVNDAGLLAGGVTLTPSPLTSSFVHSTSSPVSAAQSHPVTARVGEKEVKSTKHASDPSSHTAKPPAEKRSKPTSSGKASSSSGKSGHSKGGGASSSSASSKSTTGKGGGGGGGGAASKAGGSSAASKAATVPRSSGHAKAKSSKSKRSSRKQKPGLPSLKDLGRWKPQDDLALITAVQQTNDLTSVHTSVKFSCRFSLKEIEERWYALLYDQSISKIAMEAARQLHSEAVATIQGKALYSNAEEQLLGTFAATSQPTVDSFQSLLSQHPDVFHPARTPKTLQAHWLMMKQHHLLPDQNVQPLPRGDHILNLSDIEDFINDEDISDGKDDTIEQELTLADRRNKREIRHLEQEMPKWHVLVDSVTGISMPDFDNQTLGVLRGRLVRYLMRSREISLGRATKDNHVDVDLSLEGPAWKVSRRQGVVKLRNSGDFFIANEGKRPILVDGKPVLTGAKQKLNNNSVVEISCLRFTFLINQDVINSIRADNSKPAGVTAAASSLAAVS